MNHESDTFVYRPVCADDVLRIAKSVESARSISDHSVRRQLIFALGNLSIPEPTADLVPIELVLLTTRQAQILDRARFAEAE